MKKYVVIGNPISHSLSPELHNHWIKQNGIDAIYDKKKLNDNEFFYDYKKTEIKDKRKMGHLTIIEK